MMRNNTAAVIKFQEPPIGESRHDATTLLRNLSNVFLARVRARSGGFRRKLEKRSGHSDDVASADVQGPRDLYGRAAALAQWPSGNDHLPRVPDRRQHRHHA